MQRSLLLFENAIRSENTKKLYMHHLNKFLEFTKIKDYDSLLSVSKEQLQVFLEDYLFYLKKRLSPNTIPVVFSILQLFFTLNDKDFNFKKLQKMYPAPVKKSGSKAWSTKDIQNILKQATKKRTRALIHFLASTGARIGVVNEIKMRHLVEMSGKCKGVLLYEGSNEEYWGFLTPEASVALDEYLEERRNDGENISYESPVFREGYKLGMLASKPISTKMAQMVILKCIQKSSVRRTKTGKRYDIQQDHGFRKRFNTILKLNNNINSNIVEKLMGHKNGLDGVYLKPTREECFQEFQKLISDLVIDDSERLRIRNLQLEQEKSELEKKIPELVKDAIKEAVNRAKDDFRKEGWVPIK